MTIKRLALATILVGALIPAVALAGSAGTVTPSHSVRIAVLKAFGDPPAAYPCLRVRLAASHHKYATVKFRMTRPCTRWLANGVNIFKRSGTNHWKQVFVGSSYRCPIARIPRSVQRNLGICP